MTVIFNNNAWNPVPWGWGQCSGNCGGNNALTNMFGYMMMFSMMNNIFKSNYAPQQQTIQQYPYNPYPGLYLSGAGGAGGATAANGMSYQDYVKQNEETQMYNDLKSSWPEFQFSKMGDTYYAYLKDDKTVHVESSTLDGLLGKINEYVAANPDKFRKTESSGSTSGSTGTESTDGTTAADDQDSTVEGSSSSSSSGSSSSVAGSNTYPKGWRKCKTAGKSFTSIDALMNDPISVIAGDSSVNYSAQRMSKEMKDAYKAHLIKNNPSVFNKDGTIKSNADWNKLEIPDGATLRHNYGALPHCDKSKWNTSINETDLRVFKRDKAKPTDAKDMVNYFANDKKYAGYKDLNDNEKEKLVTDLIKMNPHCFNTDGTTKDTFSWDTLAYPKSSEVTATYAKTKKAEEDKKTNIPKTCDLQRYNDSKKIVFKKCGTETKVAELAESGGMFSSDAHLRVTSGVLKGDWKFKEKDGDNLNYDKFNTKYGRISAQGYNVVSLVNQDNGTELEVKTNNRGLFQVKYNGNWYDLEELIQTPA